MRIFVAGGTGVVGRRAVRLLAGGGHDVTAVSRREESDRALRAAGASPLRVDLFDAAAVRRAVAGQEVVVNLATAIPPASRALSRSAWEMTVRLRTQGARNLAHAAVAAGARRFVQESLAMAYPDRGAAWIDESTPLDPAGPQGSALAAERAVAAAVDAGLDAVALRFAMFYAPEADHTRLELTLARRGFAAVNGPPEAHRTLIHADDAAAAVVAALALPSGAYNVADDHPLTRAEHGALLGRLLGRGALRQPPAVLDRVGLLRVLARSLRVSNAKLRAHSDWRPAYPHAEDGWRAILAAADGEVGVHA